MMNPVTISVVNHKGGCLKTTVTANLAAGLARAGKKVLVIDLDSQQNLTASLIGPLPYEENRQTLYDAFIEESSLDHLIQETETRGLDIIPVTEDFAGADLSLVSVVGREFVLKNCLSKTERLKDYDLVLLDNPPSISLVVMNSLVASNFFLVPCSAEYLPMVGLALLSESIMRMFKVAPELKPLGVILTLFSHNERICRQVETMLRREIGLESVRHEDSREHESEGGTECAQDDLPVRRLAEGEGNGGLRQAHRRVFQRLETYGGEIRRAVNG